MEQPVHFEHLAIVAGIVLSDGPDISISEISAPPETGKDPPWRVLRSFKQKGYSDNIVVADC